MNERNDNSKNVYVTLISTGLRIQGFVLSERTELILTNIDTCSNVC